MDRNHLVNVLTKCTMCSYMNFTLVANVFVRNTINNSKIFVCQIPKRWEFRYLDWRCITFAFCSYHISFHFTFAFHRLKTLGILQRHEIREWQFTWFQIRRHVKLSIQTNLSMVVDVELIKICGFLLAICRFSRALKSPSLLCLFLFSLQKTVLPYI